MIDEKAEAVRAYVSDGYSSSKGIDAQEKRPIRDAQTWEEAGLENPFSPVTGEETPRAMEFEQGWVPVTSTTLATGAHSDDDVEILSRSKHAASSSLPGERVRAQKMDDDPVPMPKVKAIRTNDHVNQVAEIDMCHNDESMFPEDFETDALMLDSEDEHMSGQMGGDGPPAVSSEKLQELDERAALDEVEKLFKMDLIQPATLPEDAAKTENVVDTTLVSNWRLTNQQWTR